MFSSTEPKLQEIDDQVAKLRNESYEYTRLQTRLRKCRKDANYPPHNVRQYIKGMLFLSSFSV